MNDFGLIGLIVLTGFMVGIPAGYMYGLWWGVAGYVMGQLFMLAAVYQYLEKQKRSQ